MLSKMRRLAEVWQKRAASALKNAEFESNKIRKRLIEHGAHCNFNCYRELQRLVGEFEASAILSQSKQSKKHRVEKQNHTLRMHCRRLTRLTNAFSKKIENFEAAVALNFAYYNFVKTHSAIRMTPAMAAGIEKSHWTVAELVERCGE